MKRWFYILAALALAAGILFIGGQTTASAKPPQAPAVDPIVDLGKSLFFDANLSLNSNQSCATCHAPQVGFTGPDSAVNAGTVVYPGSVPGAYGNRKPPSAAYAGDSSDLHLTAAGWFGGMFWDGRATGTPPVSMDDPLAQQAKGPFLNPAEQALTSAPQLCGKVKVASYAGLYEKVWGAGSLDCTNAELVYQNIALSIAAYERSPEVNPFNSKFDAFWDAAKAKGKNVPGIRMGNWQNYRRLGLSDSELQGLASFNDPNRADCASCHSLQPGSQGYPLFTDFGYDNLGIPKNPANPATIANPTWADPGLGGYLNEANEVGKFKVPTLRNVDRRPSSTFVKAYGHNGYFKSLNDIVFFYHWRAMMDSGGMGGMGGGGTGGGGTGGGGMGGGGMGGMYPPPEVDQTRTILQPFPGMDVSYIVSFLKTLSDGYR